MRTFLACGLLLLSGCTAAEADYWNRPGTWRAQGSNDANLRVMVADPADLDRGRHAATARGATAARAADRLRRGQRAELPASNSTPQLNLGGLGAGGGQDGSR